MAQKADLLFFLLPRESVDAGFEPEGGHYNTSQSYTFSGTCLQQSMYNAAIYSLTKTASIRGLT